MADRMCNCGKPLNTSSNETICKACVRSTRRHLTNQAAYHDSLTTELARLTKKVAENDGGRASSATSWVAAGDRFLDEVTPEMVKDWDRRARAASSALSSQRVLLVAWTRLLVEEGYASVLPADRIPALAMFIEAHLSDLRKHDAAGELVAEFRDLTLRIIKVIDLPENRSRFTVGPCPQVYGTDDDWCPGQVEAILPADESIPGVMVCGACKAEWRRDKNEWIRVAERIQQRYAQIQGQRIMAESIARKAS